MTIYETIMAEIERRGLSGYELSRMTGLNQKTIWTFIKGADVRTSTLQTICDTLGLMLVEDPDSESRLPPPLDNPLRRL